MIIKNYIPLYYDAIFKSIFIKENILKSFLESYLNIDIRHVRILNAELSIKKIKEQKKTVDLLIEIENKIINIELNAVKNNNFIKRNMAYLFSIYTQNFQNNIKKKEYQKEYVQLNLNKFSISKSKRYKEVYHLKNEYGDILSKNIEIHEINLDYFHELWYSINKLQVILKDKKKMVSKEMDKELYEKIEKLRLRIREMNAEIKVDNSILWMGLIGSKTKKEFEYILNRKEMGNMAKEIKQTVEFICDPSLVITIFDKEDIEWYNRQGDIEYGEERGIKKGKKEEKKNIARNMLKSNLEISFIQKMTNLPLKEILKLKKNLQ